MVAPLFEPGRADHDSSIGVRAGHWTNREARTGCTVVVLDRPAPTIADVRGGAPGTRETDLLAPGRLVRSADAILLTGGSAFGLAAADGVMRFLADQNRGVKTAAGPVPIVPTAVIFDLAVGSPLAPGPEDGQAACETLMPVPDLPRGLVGAGTGATTNKLFRNPQRGGLGLSTVAWSAGEVTAIVVVNAAGAAIDAETGDPVLAGTHGDRVQLLAGSESTGHREATTLAVLLVAAPVDETALIRCAVAAHDGFARAIRPCHTIFDGDVVFAVGLTPGTPTPRQTLDLSVASELAIERAIYDAVTA